MTEWLNWTDIQMARMVLSKPRIYFYFILLHFSKSLDSRTVTRMIFSFWSLWSFLYLPLYSDTFLFVSLRVNFGLWPWIIILYIDNLIHCIQSLTSFYFISSVQFSCSVVSDILLPHWLEHARPPSITNSRSLLKL